MKLIEAMKRVKANKEKIVDLQNRIKTNSAYLSFETPLYPDAKDKIVEWSQSCFDTAQENVRLLTAIGRTNLATQVTITLNEKAITKPISEWVWRRREYATLDMNTYAAMTDRGLKEGQAPSSVPGGEPVKVAIVRNYDPALRDKMIAVFRTEPHEIDSALEVVNAITDIVEA